MILKIAKVIVNWVPVSSKDYKEYRRLANGYSFNPQLPDFSDEEEKKLSSSRDNHKCGNGITFSKEEAKIIERCTKNGTELHYSKKYGLTYTNVFGEELPVICLRGMFYMYTDEEIKNMKK